MLNFKWDTSTAKVHNLWLCIKDTDLIFGFTSFLIICLIKKIFLFYQAESITFICFSWVLAQ